MAKKRTRQSRLNTTAAALGTGLGHLAARYDALVKQRDELAQELRGYLSSAERLLAGLTQSASVGIARGERQVAKAAKRVNRKFTAASRARLSQLAKERWAKAKKAGKNRLG